MSSVVSATPSPARAAGLGVHSLSKTFPGTKALDVVSFEVARGTIHALLGGNGSGKSTLIKILAGVEVGDPGGRVRFGASEGLSDHLDPGWAAGAGLRFVHQDLGLFENLTVAENLFAGRRPPCRAGRVDWRRMRGEAQAVLDRLEIAVGAADDLAAVRPADRTLVAIARALPDAGAMASTLLVLDEPTARLAEAETQRLLEALRRYAGQGLTVLFVSHRLEEVFELARSATVLRDGRHVHTGPLAELDEPAIVELMVGRALAAEDGDHRRRIARPHRPGDPVLSVEHLVSGPLRGVDLTLAKGEILGVAGLVGAGRTELLETIFGARRREAGSVELAGRPLRSGRIDSAIRHGVALVPEDRGGEGIFPDLGIPENLSAAHPRRYLKRLRFRHGEERRDAAAAIDRWGIRAPDVTATLNRLSGGNQQKVVLARWLLNAPTLLLLDEPTQGVDIAARQDLHREIRTMAGAGCGVLVVSSDPDELLGLSDRVIVLAGGRIVAEAAGEALDHAWLGAHLYTTVDPGVRT